MDGNKDAALKCLEIGRDALRLGDRPRALRFITKANRLDPSLSVDDLLSKLDDSQSPLNINNDNDDKSATTESNSAHFNETNSGPRRRVPATGSSSSSSTASAAVPYTEEQVLIVREIKRKKDYYEILGVEKACNVEDIRKAYRKLSLKVHPDKNKAPGAEEAFKLVSKSFQCLSDVESRNKYDLVGSDDEVYERRRNQGFNNGFYDGGEVDAEEIFRNFFFGGMHPAATTQFRGGFGFGPGAGVRMGNQNGSYGGASNLRALIQFLPVILIFLLNFLPSSEPVYSLSRGYPYEHRVTTQKGVNFYVKSTKFEQDYPYGSEERGALELTIEREYFSILNHNCQIERQRLQWGFIKEAPNCDALKKFQSAA